MAECFCSLSPKIIRSNICFSTLLCQYIVDYYDAECFNLLVFNFHYYDFTPLFKMVTLLCHELASDVWAE